ncbi:MAG: 1,4-dihydroxy-2-naphthoate octaprenyltransferase [Muribaculaceae bacterium]|nr:1,4-dihydroxy-2-naphthoate octaprenyltransferase [Muribaculaceae bacterium]
MPNPWIEAMRLRTLPVSVAGVIAGTACAIFYGGFDWIPAVCCLLFALGAQIASNFANEYFDFRNGLDRRGRDGFRRGVAEGDISPRAMLRATIAALALAALPGLVLIAYGGWWLIAVGVLVGIFALAYSAGPYPLSHHGLGDVAVVVFFGLVPVGFTAWLQTGTTAVLPLACAVGAGVGLLAANVLIVNNYRDADDDRAVGKRTTVVIFGRPAMRKVYGLFSAAGITLMCAPAAEGHYWSLMPLLLGFAAWRAFRNMARMKGSELNGLLRQTAILLLGASLLTLAGVLLPG